MRHFVVCDNCGADMLAYCGQYPPVYYLTPTAERQQEEFKQLYNGESDTAKALSYSIFKKSHMTYLCDTCINQ